jgi:hypothetical protein
MTSPTYQRELKKAVKKMDLMLGPKPIFCAIDVETTLNGNEDIGLAHPMHPDNRVVAYGMCHKSSHRTTYDCDMFDALYRWTLDGGTPFFVDITFLLT